MNFLVDVEDQNIKKEMEISLQASELVGMHYTSIENIHKVIEPLFLDGLKEEFAEIKDLKVLKTKNLRLSAFQKKLSSLTFLDPVAGEDVIIMLKGKNAVTKRVF